MASKPTLLKNSQYIPDVHGEIVRFNSGKSSLMRVEKTDTDSFGKRLYGTNIIGNHHAAYAHNCERASKADMQLWKSTESDRNY